MLARCLSARPPGAHRLPSLALRRLCVGRPSPNAGRQSASAAGTSRAAASASGRTDDNRWDNTSLAAGCLAVAVAFVGLTYASVPLYRIFCQATGFGGTVKTHKGSDDDEGYNLPSDPSTLPNNRTLKITFNSDVHGDMPWTFKAVQRSISVLAGQTALAFFEATNNSSEPIIGVATYNVVPNEAGAYFNKIQCFCFTDERLGPGEAAEMPLVLYVDRQLQKDPETRDVTEITLSYTFFPDETPPADTAALDAGAVQRAGEEAGAVAKGRPAGG